MMEDNKKLEDKKFNPESHFFTVPHILLLGLIVTVLMIVGIIIFFLMNIQLSEILSIISVFIALWTLIATGIITLYIYNRERQDIEIDKQKQRDIAMEFMRLAVKDGIDWLIYDKEYRDIGPCYHIKEYMNRYEEIFYSTFSSKEFQVLIELVETLDIATHHNSGKVNSSFIYRSWLMPLADSAYHSCFVIALNDYELLSKEIYVLMQHLGVEGTEKPYVENLDKILDNEGSILFEKTDHIHENAVAFAKSVYNIFEDEEFLKYFSDSINVDNNVASISQPQSEEIYINVFDDRELVLSGSIDCGTSSIRNGFEKTHDYKGFFMNGVHWGPGIEYGYGQQKIKEGFWHDEELIAGIRYNEIVWDIHGVLRFNSETREYEGDSDAHLMEWGQYGESPALIDSELLDVLAENGMKEYYITDVKTLGEGGDLVLYSHIRPLEEFLSNENPRVLTRLVNKIEMKKEELSLLYSFDSDEE